MYKYDYLKYPDIEIRCVPSFVFVENRMCEIDKLLAGYDREIDIKERRHYVNAKRLDIESYLYVKIKEPANKKYPIVVASFHGCDGVDGVIIGRLDIINKVFSRDFYLVTIQKELVEPRYISEGGKVYAFKNQDNQDNLFKRLFKLFFKPFTKNYKELK